MGKPFEQYVQQKYRFIIDFNMSSSVNERRHKMIRFWRSKLRYCDFKINGYAWECSKYAIDVVFTEITQDTLEYDRQAIIDIIDDIRQIITDTYTEKFYGSDINE